METPAEAVKDQQIAVEIEYISLDPAMRGWINKGKSYIEPVELGAVMRAFAVGQVTESTDPGFAVGGKLKTKEHVVEGIENFPDTRVERCPDFV